MTWSPSSLWRFRGILTLFLVTVGLLQVLGTIMANPQLKLLGAASAVAPYPIPLTGTEEYEVFLAEGMVHLLYENGTDAQVPFSRQTVAEIPGSHKRKSFYFGTMGRAPNFPDSMVEESLRFAFCAGGPLSRDLGLGSDMREVRLEIEYTKLTVSNSWVYTVICES